MMGLQAILEAIAGEAEAEVAAIEARADGEVAELRARAAAEVQAIEEAAEETARAEVAEEVARITHEADLDAARAVRDAREAVVREVLQGVRARLDALRTDPAREKVLATWLAEGRRALPEATAVRVAPEDVPLVHAQALEVVPDPEVAGGVVLESPSGHRLLNTPDVRLERAEPRIRQVIGRALE